MDFKAHADELLKEWQLCSAAKPKHDAVDIQIEKNRCEEWAIQLMTVRVWGTEMQIAESCHQLEYRLKALKEKIVIEVLKNGSI